MNGRLYGVLGALIFVCTGVTDGLTLLSGLLFFQVSDSIASFALCSFPTVRIPACMNINARDLRAKVPL